MSREGEVEGSRLFILGGKGTSEEEFREVFSEYGEVKDVWIVRDKRSNEDKGVVYIRYSKASQAALALEKMNGQTMPGSPKPLRVMIASDRKEGSVKDVKEEERMLRLFIKVSRQTTAGDLEKIFGEYGDVEYVNVLRDKSTNESKGLAYVKYHRPYHAALALENCDPSYRAIFAARRNPRPDHQQNALMNEYELGPVNNFDMRSYNDTGARGGVMDMMRDYSSGLGETRLEIMTPSGLSQDRLHRLLDLIPGLEYCDLDRRSGIAFVRYSSPQCAAYAKEKLSGFEYPIGQRLGVRYPPKNSGGSMRSAAGSYNSGSVATEGYYSQPMAGEDTSSYDYQGTSSGSGGCDPQDQSGSYYNGRSRDNSMSIDQTLGQDAPVLAGNLQHLVESIQQATSVLQSAGISPQSIGGLAQQIGSLAGTPGVGNGSTDGSGMVRVRYSNIPLPEQKALASKDSAVAERLFIIAQAPFPENVLNDCLCRFGNLIDAYFMPGKNYGYAKFADVDSAMRCMETLHGQQICGQRLKIIKADPPKYSDRDSSDRDGEDPMGSNKKHKS